MPNDDLNLDSGLITPAPKRSKPSTPHLDELSEFAKKFNLQIGSTTGGRHNKGSLHYSGNAFDVKDSGGFDDVRVSALKQAASEFDLIVRDERRRPKGQAVWGGPHIHVEKAGDDPLNLDSGLADLDLDSGLVDTPTTPKSNIATPGSRGAYMARMDAVRKGGTDPYEKLARDIEWHFGYGVLQALPTLSEDKQRAIITQASQYAAEDEAKKAKGVAIPPSPAWRLKNQRAVGVIEGKDIEARTRPEEDAAQRAAFSAGANPLLRLPRAVRLIIDPLARGGAGIMDAVAGIGEVAARGGSPGARAGVEAIRAKASQARAISEESQATSPEGWKTRLGQDVGAGVVEFAPLMLIPELGIESVLARIGVAALKGAAYTGTQAVGRDESAGDVAKSAATGGATLALLGVPLPGKTLLAKSLANLAITGGGATVINLATGQPLSEAAKQGLVLTLMRAPELIGGLKVRDAKGVETPATVEQVARLGPLKDFDKNRQIAVNRLQKQLKVEKRAPALLDVTKPEQVSARIKELNDGIQRVESELALTAKARGTTSRMKGLRQTLVKRLAVMQKERNVLLDPKLQKVFEGQPGVARVFDERQARKAGVLPEPPTRVQRAELNPTKWKGQAGSWDFGEMVRGLDDLRKRFPALGDIELRAMLHQERPEYFRTLKSGGREYVSDGENWYFKKVAPEAVVTSKSKVAELNMQDVLESVKSRKPATTPTDDALLDSLVSEKLRTPETAEQSRVRMDELKAGVETPPPELRHAGLDPRAAIRAADDLQRPGFTIDRGTKGERDFSILDRFRTPISNLDFKGYMERIGGETGKQASESLRRAQVAITEHSFNWEKKLGAVESHLEQARGAIPKKEFYRDFIDLVEKDFADPSRTSTNPSVIEALKLHDELTSEWRRYIIDSRASLGIEMPPDWGITDRGYFRHLFLGDIQMFKDNHFIGTAQTYAEAQRIALKELKADPSANIHAKARQSFAGDPTVRLSTPKFWKTVSELTKSTRESAEAAAGGKVTLTKADILEDIRGTIGQARSKQKPLGALLKREGYEGASRDYTRVMEAHAGQLARTQELSKLNRELVPLIEKLRAEGKPGLAEEVGAHLNDLWGVPRRSETQVGNMIRATPVLRNHVANPDFALRTLARKITSLQTFLRLDFNLRASAVNALDPLATLWPYTTTRDYASLYRDYLRPLTRKMLRERGVLQGSTKLEGGVAEHGKKAFGQRVRDVRGAEGLGETAQALRDLPPRPFRAASDLNRGVGYLYGIKDGTRKGLTGDALHRYGLDWANKVEFDNSMWNVAPLLRGPAGKVLGQFKGYPLKALENVGTMWRQHEGDTHTSRAMRQAKFLGSRLAIGGTKAALSPVRIALGVGGYELVVALSNQLQNYGMSKDEADRTAQGVYYGMPALMGQDLSSSVAIIDDLYGKSPEEKLVNLVGGPTVGMGFGLYKANSPEKVATTLTPYARGVSTAVELAKRGEATVPISRGERMPLTDFEAVMRILGFTPVRQSIHFDAPPKSEKVKELAEKMRKGDAGALDEAKELEKASTLSKRDVSKVRDARKLSELQSTFKTYTLSRAEYEYSLMSPEDQAAVEPLLKAKRINAKKR